MARKRMRAGRNDPGFVLQTAITVPLAFMIGKELWVQVLEFPPIDADY